MRVFPVMSICLTHSMCSVYLCELFQRQCRSICHSGSFSIVDSNLLQRNLKEGWGEKQFIEPLLMFRKLVFLLPSMVIFWWHLPEYGAQCYTFNYSSLRPRVEAALFCSLFLRVMTYVRNSFCLSFTVQTFFHLTCMFLRAWFRSSKPCSSSQDDQWIILAHSQWLQWVETGSPQALGRTWHTPLTIQSHGVQIRHLNFA